MGNLSVIGGKVKGFKLQSVPGSGTRPIMSMVKAALFNIVSPYVMDSSWLDLFAGTGSVGIEALSRGGQLKPVLLKTLTGLSKLSMPTWNIRPYQNGGKCGARTPFQS